MNASAERITVDLLQRDALEMVRLLLKQFGQLKLYLVSHPWGSVMGFDIANKYRELLFAYIPISPMVDAVKSLQLTVDYLKEWATQTKNDRVVNELGRVNGPYKTPDDMFCVQKWLFIYNEVDGARSDAFRNIYITNGWQLGSRCGKKTPLPAYSLPYRN